MNPVARIRRALVARIRRALPLAAIGLTMLTAAGCASGLQPAIEMPTTSITLSTSVDAAGKIEPPQSQRSVTMTTNTILRVVLDEYPGFTWQIDKAPSTTMFSLVATEGPEVCPSGCASSRAKQYRPNATGTTTMVLTLTATGTTSSSTSSSSASPSPAAATGPTCPSGITAPPPSANVGCVLGRVTLTVTVH